MLRFVLTAFLALLSVPSAFAQATSTATVTTVGDSTECTVRKDWCYRNPTGTHFVPPQVSAGGQDRLVPAKGSALGSSVQQSAGPTPPIVYGGGKNGLGPGPIQAWPTSVPVAISTLPSYRDQGIFKNLVPVYGYPVSDSQFQIIQRLNDNMMIEELTDPERWMWLTNTAGQVVANNVGNDAALAASNTTQNAIEFSHLNLVNFTSNATNEWNALRNQLFIPIALLLLLPGAVLAQVRAIVAQGYSSILGEVNPFEGILRAMIAIFLIPGTYLVMNYGIDVSNSISISIAQGYMNLFHTSMYADAKAMVQRANAVNPPTKNLNAIIPPTGNALTSAVNAANSALTGNLASSASGVAAFASNELASHDATNQPVEQYTALKSTNRFIMNLMNATMGTTWLILCAFQVVFLYYLWCMGPIVAALWVWPIDSMRRALGSWVEGVLTLCFWSLFWNTVIVIMACFKGVGSDGENMNAALCALANLAVVSAFNFTQLVSSAAGFLQQAVSSAGSGGAAAGQAAGSGGTSRATSSAAGGQAGAGAGSRAGGAGAARGTATVRAPGGGGAGGGAGAGSGGTGGAGGVTPGAGGVPGAVAAGATSASAGAAVSSATVPASGPIPGATMPGALAQGAQGQADPGTPHSAGGGGLGGIGAPPMTAEAGSHHGAGAGGGAVSSGDPPAHPDQFAGPGAPVDSPSSFGPPPPSVAADAAAMYGGIAAAGGGALLSAEALGASASLSSALTGVDSSQMGLIGPGSSSGSGQAAPSDGGTASGAPSVSAGGAPDGSQGKADGLHGVHIVDAHGNPVAVGQLAQAPPPGGIFAAGDAPNSPATPLAYNAASQSFELPPSGAQTSPVPLSYEGGQLYATGSNGHVVLDPTSQHLVVQSAQYPSDMTVVPSSQPGNWDVTVSGGEVVYNSNQDMAYVAGTSVPVAANDNFFVANDNSAVPVVLVAGSREWLAGGTQPVVYSTAQNQWEPAPQAGSAAPNDPGYAYAQPAQTYQSAPAAEPQQYSANLFVPAQEPAGPKVSRIDAVLGGGSTATPPAPAVAPEEPPAVAPTTGQSLNAQMAALNRGSGRTGEQKRKVLSANPWDVKEDDEVG